MKTRERAGGKRRWRCAVSLALVLMLLPAACLWGQRCPGSREDAPASSLAGHALHGDEIQRIVSLAPSVTEVLFMLDLGDKVAGVTRYCLYPPDARGKAKIGGYCDPNCEAVVALGPDLVVMLPEHDEHRKILDRMGVASLVVDHRTVEGILESITAIGRACGREPEALAATDDLRARIERIRSRTAGLARTRVMVSVGRNMGSGRIRDIYITGRSVFYDDLIRLAGGVNAYGGDAAFPIVSEEGVIRMNPEVIIDMVPDLEEKGISREAALGQWEELEHVDAVRNRRVYVFSRDYTVVPGPRFILVLEEMARVMHPEVDWR